jgi:hypothetical protein
MGMLITPLIHCGFLKIRIFSEVRSESEGEHKDNLFQGMVCS